MKNACLIFFCSFFSGLSAQTDKTTTIYLIRHCEKVDLSANPDLSEKGKLRAAEIEKYLSNKPIHKFYSTGYKRTRQTCEIIAAKSKTQITIYEHKNMNLKQLIADNPGESILIVGHGNTIPGYINALLGQQKYADIPESEFNNLYIIKASNSGISDELIKL